MNENCIYVVFVTESDFFSLLWVSERNTMAEYIFNLHNKLVNICDYCKSEHDYSTNSAMTLVCVYLYINNAVICVLHAEL